jgi:hypothetical protein
MEEVVKKGIRDFLKNLIIFEAGDKQPSKTKASYENEMIRK